jgi:hypothetical protein
MIPSCPACLIMMARGMSIATVMRLHQDVIEYHEGFAAFIRERQSL